MMYLMDGGPFQASHFGDHGHVVAYRDGRFLFVRANGCTLWAARGWFVPHPPIPAAASKPEAGEVWVFNYGSNAGWAARLIVQGLPWNGRYKTIAADGEPGEWHIDDIVRPATLEEAEPFRPLFDGLKRSLGEE